MTDKFPLLRLPYVALHEVLNHVGHEVILLLSLCSKRSNRLLKLCQGPRKAINITLNVSTNFLKVDYEPLVTAVCILVVSVSKLQADLKTVKIGSHVVPVEMKGNILMTYWMDGKEGLKEVIKHTSDVFSRDLYSIEGCGAVSSENARYWLKWIKTRQDTLPRLSLWSTIANVDDLLMNILESNFVTGDLLLYPTFSSGFRGPSPRPYSIDYLYLHQSKWVTLNHLLAMDIKRITLNDSPLTCQEINTFLKKWIDGECSKRIKELYVDMGNEVNYNVLIEGIEVNRRRLRLRRDYASYNGVERIFGGFDIKRKEDGAVATIVKQPRGILTKLKVVFWPDHKGTQYH